MTTPPPLPSPDKTPRLNPRVIGMLVVFTVIISASVVATDLLSVRTRAGAAQPASFPAPPASRPR